MRIRRVKVRDACLGTDLRDYRIKAGYSQKFVAKKMGYTNAQYISNLERSTCNPPLKSLKKYLNLIEYPYDMYKKRMHDALELKMNKALSLK